jgi:hypothetical protein
MANKKERIIVKRVKDYGPSHSQAEADKFNCEQHLKRLEEQLIKGGLPGLSALRLIHAYTDPNDRYWQRDVVYAEIGRTAWGKGRKATAAEQQHAINISEGIDNLEPSDNDQIMVLSFEDEAETDKILSFNPGLQVISKHWNDLESKWEVKLKVRRFSTMVSNF